MPLTLHGSRVNCKSYGFRLGILGCCVQGPAGRKDMTIMAMLPLSTRKVKANCHAVGTGGNEAAAHSGIPGIPA